MKPALPRTNLSDADVASCCPQRSGAAYAYAYTKLDLLVVIGTLTVLGGLSLPLLAKARERAQRNQCMSNLKQLAVAWQSYAAEHNGEVVPNHGMQETRFRRSNWVNNVLSWGVDADNTNLMLLANGKLAPYLGSDTRVYQCPTDHYLSLRQKQAGWTTRTRSVALNAFLGGSSVVLSGNNLEHEDYVHVQRNAEIARPSMTFLFLDEHPDRVDDGNFFMHPGFELNLRHWHDIPGTGHNGAGGVSFVDGHVELHDWGLGAINSRMTYADLLTAPTFETAAEKAGADWLSQRTASQKISK